MHVPSPSAEKARARTAALAALVGQLTDTKRDAHGLVAEIASSVTGRVDGVVRIARDGHDRVTRVDYGNGEVETFAYDAAGRLVKEGDRTYRYGYLDKVLSVAGGGKSFTYSYHADGRLARADYGGGRSEDFLWDGLALVRRGDEQFVNEPHPGNAPKKLCFEGKPRAERSARRARKGPRGNPVLSSKGAAYLNDMLGTTVGVRDGPRGRRRYSAAALTAFGEPPPGAAGGEAVPSPFFTGKPDVPGLGRVFLMRNYRPRLAKWQTADPLGYPDGWNQLAYGDNEPESGVDRKGGSWSRWDDSDFVSYYFTSYRVYGDGFDTDCMGLTSEIFSVINGMVLPRVVDQIDQKVEGLVGAANGTSGGGNFRYGTSNSYSFGSVCFSLGDGSVQTSSQVTYSWSESRSSDARYRYYEWTAKIWINYSDIFEDPLDVGLELPSGQAYYYYHTWTDVYRNGFGVVVLE